MAINKFGASQQMRDIYMNENSAAEEKQEVQVEEVKEESIYMQNSVTEFTPSELEVLSELDRICTEKGVSQDLLVDKLFKYKK